MQLMKFFNEIRNLHYPFSNFDFSKSQPPPKKNPGYAPVSKSFLDGLVWGATF